MCFACSRVYTIGCCATFANSSSALLIFPSFSPYLFRHNSEASCYKIFDLFVLGENFNELIDPASVIFGHWSLEDFIHHILFVYPLGLLFLVFEKDIEKIG